MTQMIAFDTETCVSAREGLPQEAITEMWGKATDFASVYAGFYGSIVDVINNGDRLVSLDYTECETRVYAVYAAKGRIIVMEEEQKHLDSYNNWLTHDEWYDNFVYGNTPYEREQARLTISFDEVILLLGTTNYYKGGF